MCAFDHHQDQIQEKELCNPAPTLGSTVQAFTPRTAKAQMIVLCVHSGGAGGGAEREKLVSFSRYKKTKA